MMACCYLCYSKYINEDGTIDYDRVDKAKQYQIISLVGQKPSKRSPTEEDILNAAICTCGCHKDGIAILH